MPRRVAGRSVISCRPGRRLHGGADAVVHPPGSRRARRGRRRLASRWPPCGSFQLPPSHEPDLILITDAVPSGQNALHDRVRDLGGAKTPAAGAAHQRALTQERQRAQLGREFRSGDQAGMITTRPMVSVSAVAKFIACSAVPSRQLALRLALCRRCAGSHHAHDDRRRVGVRRPEHDHAVAAAQRRRMGGADARLARDHLFRSHFRPDQRLERQRYRTFYSTIQNGTGSAVASLGGLTVTTSIARCIFRRTGPTIRIVWKLHTYLPMSALRPNQNLRRE
jgi:hypothetical protein